MAYAPVPLLRQRQFAVSEKGKVQANPPSSDTRCGSRASFRVLQSIDRNSGGGVPVPTFFEPKVLRRGTPRAAFRLSCNSYSYLYAISAIENFFSNFSRMLCRAYRILLFAVLGRHPTI